jgi:tetratricopeptide (TPR) repeat protein
LAKEQAVVLPGLALALDWHGRTMGRLGRLPWKEYALYGLVVALWLALRWQVLGGFAVPDISGLDNPLVELAPSVRIANAGAIAWRYLGLLVVPYKLSADYSFAALPVYADFFSWALVASAALGMAILLVVRKFARAPGLRSLGALWMLIAFSLVANVAAPIGTIMAERLLYLPSVGFCLLVAALMKGVWGLGRRRLFVLACTVLVAVLLGRTWARNADWRDAETLFRAAIAAYPHSAKAHQGLGEAMMKRGDWLGALDEFGRAAAIYPQYAAAHYNSGLCYWWLRQYENAIAAYERAVAIRPGYARAWMNMGAAHHALGALAAAAAAYRQAVDTRPDFAPAWENLAHTYREMGDRDRAVAAYRAFLRLRPEHERRAEYEQWIGGT